MVVAGPVYFLIKKEEASRSWNVRSVPDARPLSEASHDVSSPSHSIQVTAFYLLLIP